ncbi:MAG TPA: DUF1015 domain-containing protein [Mycobacteriales bacterium]|nr:DUF1015 domain-containing protein [Mycobacteriales bacterium]
MTSVASPPPASSPGPEGLRLSAFRALRFSSSDPAPLLSPPYDVVDEDERRELEAADPHNVVRLILPRDDGGEPRSAYSVAASLLQAWRSDGVLVPDDTPALYVYEMEEGSARTRGLVGAVGLTPPEAGIVLPHENTMAGPVADRLALTEATQANLEPIYLVYSGGGAASQAVAAVSDTEPLVTTVSGGVTHRIWAITDPAVLHAIESDLLSRRAVIADGHHRYATYLRHQADRHAAGDGAGPWDRGLALLVDASTYGPQVHAIHRYVPGLALDNAVSQAAAGFSVRDVPADSAVAELTEAGKGAAFLLTDGSRWVLLTDPEPAQVDVALPAERSAAWRALDVTIAHRLLIDRLWGLQDTEDVVGFEHDVPAAVAAAQRTGGTALLLNPTPVEAVAAVAEAGERMPRKSTLFTPKPRTGLLIRAYSDEPDFPS